MKIRDEVIGRFGKVRNKKLHNLYSFRNIVGLNVSRKMREARHMARTAG
jgi:hypothetical protein